MSIQFNIDSVSLLFLSIKRPRIIGSKRFLTVIICLLCLEGFSQRVMMKRITVIIDSSSFIGTWKLTKLADKHLKFLRAPVRKEELRFTKDSVYITLDRENFYGTWSLTGTQPDIKVYGTNQFKYKWTAGTKDSKFFSTEGLEYYKYFERISH
jgi:hypothetical protein